MKAISPAPLIALGLCLVAGGFVYDVMFAGIPYQDPTPALAASYTLHSRIASGVRWVGLGVVGVGWIVLMARRFDSWRKRRPGR